VRYTELNILRCWDAYLLPPWLGEGIRSSAQTRQKTRPMDVKLHVTILHLHSEYLAQLCTDVSAHLGTLKQTLSEGTALTSADTSGRLEEMAFLQRRLYTEGALFCQRLLLFLEESKTGHDAPEQSRQQTAAEVGLARKSAIVVR
jgi:hypothetical protein